MEKFRQRFWSQQVWSIRFYLQNVLGRKMSATEQPIFNVYSSQWLLHAVYNPTYLKVQKQNCCFPCHIMKKALQIAEIFTDNIPAVSIQKLLKLHTHIVILYHIPKESLIYLHYLLTLMVQLDQALQSKYQVNTLLKYSNRTINLNIHFTFLA